MTTISITSDQQKQYQRFFDDARDRALKEINPDKDGLQRLIERGGEFQAYVVSGISRFSAKQPNYTLARTILGKDFISPEEVAKTRQLAYTDEQLAKFGETLPSQSVLEWLRDNGFILVAGPPRDMSLLDILALHNLYFYSKTDGWYANNSEKFARDDKVASVWVTLRKEPVPGSTSKTWDQQQTLLSEVEVTPNAAATTWAVTTYKAVRNIYLFPNVYVRTSSCGSEGNRVRVGGFDDRGLNVNDYWDHTPDHDFGVASSRK